MKAIRIVRVVSGALIVMAAAGVHAQDNSAGSVPAATVAASSGKAMRVANRKLEKSVRHALVKAMDAQAAKITIRARNGVVFLKGSVPEQALVDQASQIARGVAGVTAVHNGLVIKPLGRE